MNGKHTQNQTQRGFTRADLCAVLMAVALLAFIALPTMGKMKPQSDLVSCANNLRQLGLAMAMYSADNNRQFPVRTRSNAWPTTILPGYKDLRLLVCPSDGPNPATFNTSSNYPADRAPRSYIHNGWSDFYKLRFPQSPPTTAICETDIGYPAATIAFGEKAHDSGHFYFDFDGYDDIQQIEQARHDRSQQTPQTGGSNHAMVDGQVQYLKYGAALAPVNLWAVTEQYRTNAIPVP
jgi:competence protein ComGC